MPGQNANINDAQTMHLVGLQRRYTSIANSFDPYLRAIDKAIREELSKTDKIVGRRELNRVVANVKKEMNSQFKAWFKEEDQLLQDLISTELAFQQRIHQSESNKVDGPKYLTPEAEAVWENALDEEMILSGSASTINYEQQQFQANETARITNIIIAGAVGGLAASEILTNIRGTKANRFNDGALAVTKRNQEAYTKSIANHSATVAQNDFQNRNRSIAGYEIVATLDFRTSDICKGYDGTIVLKDSPQKPRPPFHYRCRTSTVTVFTDASGMITRSDGTRASKGATGGQQVSAQLSYYDWLKKQPAWFQDEALGKTKGKIFRNSGLTADEFKKASRNRFGQPLTIEEMAESDSRIAEYIDTL